MHWIYLIHEFDNLSWITEINELFHDILIYWDAPVHLALLLWHSTEAVTFFHSPSWLKQWEERWALRLRLLTAIWILSWRSSRLCKGKLMVLETRIDKESSRGIGMRLLAPRQNNRNLIFFWLPRTVASAKAVAGKSTLGRALQWDALASSPILQTLIINYYTHIYIKICTRLPSPDPSPPSLWTASLTSGSVASTENGCGTGWLPAGAGLLPLLQSRVSMVYVLFVAEVFFLFSHCTPQGA